MLESRSKTYIGTAKNLESFVCNSVLIDGRIENSGGIFKILEISQM